MTAIDYRRYQLYLAQARGLLDPIMSDTLHLDWRKWHLEHPYEKHPHEPLLSLGNLESHDVPGKGGYSVRHHTYADRGYRGAKTGTAGTFTLNKKNRSGWLWQVSYHSPQEKEAAAQAIMGAASTHQGGGNDALNSYVDKAIPELFKARGTDPLSQAHGHVDRLRDMTEGGSSVDIPAPGKEADHVNIYKNRGKYLLESARGLYQYPTAEHLKRALTKKLTGKGSMPKSEI